MNRILLSIIFIASSIFSFSQDAKEFSLKNAIGYGIKNNDNFKNVILDEEIRTEVTKENVAIGMPQIKASFDYNYAFKQAVSVIPAESFGPQQTEPQEVTFSQPHTATAVIEATQLVFDSRYFYGLSASKNIKKIAALNTQLNKSNLEKEIALAYYAVLVTNNSIEKLEENKLTIAKLHFETNEMYKEGLVDELSVNRLELNLSNISTSINNTKVNLKNAKLNLKYTIGFPLDEELHLTDNLETLLAETSTELTNNGNPDDRVELQMMKVQDELNTLNVKQTLSNYFPNIYLYANYGTQAQREEFDIFDDHKWFQSGRVGLVVNVPIFDGLKHHYQSQQIKLNRQKNRNSIESFAKSYEFQTSSLKNQLIEAQNQLEAQKENRTLAEKIFNKTNIMFSEGIGSSFELSQAQASLTTSQINYSVAVYNLVVARYNLKSALSNE